MLFYLLLLDSDEDKSKFEQLYIAYRDLMYYVAYKILRDAQQSEDVVHTAFLKIIKRFSDLGEISCPQTRSFCVIICRNISLDILRKKKKNQDVQFDDSWNEVSCSSLTDEEAISDINAEIIMNQILKLPDIYRDVFYLFYSNGYPIKQIAKTLGISYEAAKKRLQRSKMLLIQYLRREGIE